VSGARVRRSTNSREGRAAWTVATLLGLAVLALAIPVAAQAHLSSEERFFRVEWQTEPAEGRPPAIVGFLSHDYLYPVQHVQLRVQVLNDEGQLTHETLGAIGDVPSGVQRSFRLPLPAIGSRYVVTVHSFEFGAAQSP